MNCIHVCAIQGNLQILEKIFQEIKENNEKFVEKVTKKLYNFNLLQNEVLPLTKAESKIYDISYIEKIKNYDKWIF